MIWMFLGQNPSDEDVETMVVFVELVYQMIFHLISPFMYLGIREWWTSLSLSLSLSLS